MTNPATIQKCAWCGFGPQEGVELERSTGDECCDVCSELLRAFCHEGYPQALEGDHDLMKVYDLARARDECPPRWLADAWKALREGRFDEATAFMNSAPPTEDDAEDQAKRERDRLLFNQRGL